MTTTQASLQEAAEVAQIIADTFVKSPYPSDTPKVWFNTWEDGRTVLMTEHLPFGWMHSAQADAMKDRKLWPKDVWIEAVNEGVTAVYKEV